MDFQVRVRGKTYLWGSAGNKDNLASGPPTLYLTFRTERHGEQVTYVREVLDNQGHLTPSQPGTLEPGEAVTIVLNGASGVSAQIPAAGCSTVVSCSVHTAGG
jgi:hypothetical protein